MMKKLENVYLLNRRISNNSNGDGNGFNNGYGNGFGSGAGYSHHYYSVLEFGYGEVGSIDNNNVNGKCNDNGDGFGDCNNNCGYGYGSANPYHDGKDSGYANTNGPYFIKIWNDWFEISGKIEDSLCRNISEYHYDKINKEFVQKITNLENLRILREKIGLEKYLSLFDAKVIHEEIDSQGNKMRLFKYNEKGEDVILLEVVCPSTKRVYHLYPPNLKAKTCTEAKKSTFWDKPIAIRQGDVGLIRVGEYYTIPFSET